MDAAATWPGGEPVMDLPADLIGTDQAAKALGTTERAVQKFILDGALPGYQVPDIGIGVSLAQAVAVANAPPPPKPPKSLPTPKVPKQPKAPKPKPAAPRPQPAPVAAAVLAPKPAPALPDGFPSDLLSTGEAAALIRVSRASIRRWVHSGRMPGFKIGAHLKVSKADVIAFAARVEPESGPMIETRASVVARANLVEETLRRAGIRK